MTQNRPPEPTPPDQGDPRDQLYPPVEEDFWDDRTTPGDKPPASEMLQGLMTQKHDLTQLSVAIPVKKLRAVIAEVADIEHKAQANGQLCMEKTRELVRLRAELSACQQSLEARNSMISKVWELIDKESPFGEDLRAEDVRAALSTRPLVDAQSVLGETVEPVADVPATEEPQAEVALDRGDQTG